MSTVQFECPFCHEVKDYELTESEQKDYEAYHAGRIKVVEMHQPPYFRELFITGICYKCQSETFNVSTPGYDLGEVIGNCVECDCELHQKDMDKGYCPTCGCPLKEVFE